MTRKRRITVTAGPLAARLLAARRRLSWLGVLAVAMVLAAGLLGTAPAAYADSALVDGVSLAQVGNDLLMVGTGSNSNLVVYYQTVGSSTWSEVTATAPDTLNFYDHTAAITALTEWVGLRRITLIGMAAQGPEGSLNFWWQPLADIGSGPWHQEVLSGANTTFSVPSIVQIGNEVAIAAEGADYNLDFWWQQIGATGWNSFLGQAPGLVQSPPTMAVLASPSDTLGITFVDDFGNVYYIQQTPAMFGSWQGPYTLGNTDFPGVNTAPSITALNNNLTAITTIGSNDSLYQWMTPDPPSFVNTTQGAFPGTVYNGVSTAQLGGGVVATTTQSTGDVLEFYWRLPDSYWHLEDLGDPGAFNYTAPQVIALTNSAGTQLAVTAVETPDLGADLYWQTIGASTWNLVTLPPGSFGA
jgi:hypothetical protein